ncbi:MAG: Ig-like domain-containing protein [Clostridia bacterium]|nr:Ig-like domain-containing protein [Clostridia bacterium]
MRNKSKKTILSIVFIVFVMIVFAKNSIAIQGSKWIVTMIGPEELIIPKDSKDTNFKFNVKLQEKSMPKLNIKVEYYNKNNIVLKNKTNEFIVEDTSIVHLTGKNAIDTYGLQEGNYTIVMTIQVQEYQKEIKVPLKVVPKLTHIKLKLKNNFEKDYSINETQPVIIPVTVYGVGTDKKEYPLNDELLEIQAYFMEHMNLPLYNRSGTYYLTLDVKDLEMVPDEYEITFQAKKYEDETKETIQYEAKASTNLSIVKGIKSIDFDTDKIEVEKGKEKKIDLQVTPSDATKENVKWTSNNEEVAMVKEGTIKAMNIGSTIVTAMVADKKAEILVIVKPIIYIDDMNIKDIINSLTDPNQVQINFETQKDLLLNQEILTVLNYHREKNLSILVKDEHKTRYSWTFHGTDISKDEFSDIALKIGTSLEAPNLIKNNGEEKIKEDVLYINFEHEGEIPCDVDIGVYVGDKFKVKDKVRLYYYNSDNQQLEFKNKDLEVNAEGMISFSIDHCSTYVISQKPLLPEKGTTVTFVLITSLCVVAIFLSVYFIHKKKRKQCNNFYKYQ